MFKAPKQKYGKNSQQSSNTIKYLTALQEKDNKDVCAPQELINQLPHLDPKLVKIFYQNHLYQLKLNPNINQFMQYEHHFCIVAKQIIFIISIS